MRVVDRESLREVVRGNPLCDVVAEHGVELVELGPGLCAGRCPFCREPVGRSLLVFVADERFRCLVCRHGGDAVGLVMLLDCLGFLAAVQQLAERAGLDFDALFPDEHSFRTARPSRSVVPPSMPHAARCSEVPVWALTPPPFLGADL